MGDDIHTWQKRLKCKIKIGGNVLKQSIFLAFVWTLHLEHNHVFSLLSFEIN